MLNPLFWMALTGVFFAFRWVADEGLRALVPRVRRVVPARATPVVAVGVPELLEAAEPVEELPEAA